MLCRIEGERTDSTLALTIASDGAPAPPFVARTIALATTGAGAFPLPPASEQPRWAGTPHEPWCAGNVAAISASYQRLLDNDPQPGEVALFGRYLAEALLGPNLDLIESHADVIDLRLRLNESSLERLPWELMHGSQGPLAARAKLRISIAREVRREGVDPAAPPVAIDLPLPLRVLFVVGATIDPVLRPGAELLGLLRHLQIPIDPTFSQFKNANVHIRYLGDADVDALKHQLATFSPSVVHFICHGERQPGTVETRIVLKQLVSGAGGPVKQKLTLSSGELFDAFEDAGVVPPIVVLNACYAGGAAGGPTGSGDGHLPFAADLVQRGVAIAVGMAGEVEDRACQLFARRFYQALVANEAITVATTQARRTVLAAWPDYQQSLEWARPTLFVAQGIDPTVATTKPATLDVIERAGRFRQVGTSPSMLCDRYEVLAAAQELFELADNPGNDQLLVAMRVDADARGLGKTRLLEEIAVRAIFDRFLPVIIRGNVEPPQTLLEFALVLSDAMDETRGNLKLDKVLRTRARLVAFDVFRNAANPATDPDAMSDAQFKDQRYTLRDRLRALPPPGGNVPAARICDAIAEDCAQLAGDAAARTGTAYRVLILIDELHRYAGAIDPILDNIRFAGFGTEEAPIPVVVNYVDATPEGESIRKKLQYLPIQRRPDLKRFESEDERQLAYRQLILSAFNVAPNPRRDKSVKTLVDKFFADIHVKTGGRPVEFTGLEVQSFIETVKSYSNALVDADYEDVLKQFGRV